MLKNNNKIVFILSEISFFIYLCLCFYILITSSIKQLIAPEIIYILLLLFISGYFISKNNVYKSLFGLFGFIIYGIFTILESYTSHFGVIELCIGVGIISIHFIIFIYNVYIIKKNQL